MARWLIADTNYLGYRAFHSTGRLAYGAEGGTGVVYGVLRDMVAFIDRFAADNVAWCFDHRPYHREAVYPLYKINRNEKKLTPDDLKAVSEVRRQVNALRDEHLSAVGFKNVLHGKGFEADDMVAAVVRALPKKDRAVIVGSDHDLFQLISGRVVVWNPTTKQVTDEREFVNKYGVWPDQWAQVRALAGCATDNVKGVPGVGEKTAVLFLNGQVKKGSKTHAKFWDHESVLERNLPLVRLPYEGTPHFQPQDDQLSPAKWRALVTRLGMHSLVHSLR